MKKIGIIMSLLMGVTLSFFMSLIGTLTSGHFTFLSWLISFGISLVISIVIGLIVPMQRIEAAACKKAKLHPGTTKADLLSALISDTIYTPLLSIVMTVIMVSASTAALDRQITILESELSTVEQSLSEVTAELDSVGDSDPERAAELRAKTAGLSGQSEALSSAVSGMKAAKPRMGMAILISILFCYPSGFVIIFIFRPMFLKMLLKKLAPPHGANGGPPQGMPPDIG